MEPPLKRLLTDDTSSEKQNCGEETENQQTPGNVLTYDELRSIFQYLSAKDLYTASSVCRSWRLAAQKEAATRYAPEYFLKSYQIHNKEKTKDECNPVLIGKNLRIKPYVGLICEKIQEADEWKPEGCYCKNLPFTCTTIIAGGYDIIADEANINEEIGMAVSAFLPQIPKLNRRVFGELKCTSSFYPSDSHMESVLEQILPAKGEKSKCIIMLSSESDNDFIKSFLRNLQKSYKPGTISLWGGICVDLKTCIPTQQLICCSDSISWSVITLSSPSLQSWSIVLPRNCRSEAQMEEKLQTLEKKIKIKKHSLGLMFACCERIHIKNKEIAVFKKVFPNIPLIGLHGDGEFGLNTLNEKRESQLHYAYSTIFLILTYQ